MPKLFAICRMVGGLPDIDVSVTPVRGWVHAASIGNQGTYLFSGTGPQLVALNALPQVLGICVVTEDGETRWAELDRTIPPVVRNRINTWLSARGYPSIPAGWSYRVVVFAIFRFLSDRFDPDVFDISGT